MDLENAAARSHSALIEAKSAAQVALLEARQQLTEEWTARQAQATGKLQERLSQREGEILALQTARSKERDDLHAQARAECVGAWRSLCGFQWLMVGVRVGGLS